MRIAALSRTASAIGLSAALVLSSQFATMARAEIVGTDSVIARYGENADRAFLLSQLQTDEIRGKLIEMGVDPAEAQARLAALTDQEIRSMLAQFDEQNAGGDILGTLLTLFVILLVTDFLCLTKIFKFTRCA